MRHEFEGLHRQRSVCDVRIGMDQHGVKYVILTELQDNPGSSVTNSIESLIPSVMNRFLKELPLEHFFEFIWLERYDLPGREDQYDQIVFDKSKRSNSFSGWKRFGELPALELIVE